MINYEDLKKANEEFFPEYRQKLDEVLNKGWFVLGENVKQFEEEFAAYCGAKYCLGVASGLDALFLSLKVLNLPEGSEVIVPSNTYIATILSIVQCKLQPVLVEPDIATYNINPELIEKHITKKTKAIMVVHLYGKLCAMEEIKKTADKHGLKIIEDCAQAHGAAYKGQRAGNWGDFGAFSFYPTKNLGCLGDGGAITTNDQGYYEKLKELRNYGSSVKYYNNVVGYNSRLDELQAAFLRVKLKKLDAINEHKRKLAKIYFAGLDDKFIKPVIQQDYYDVYHIYNIRHKEREKIREYLLQNQIRADIHYPVSPHRQKAMIGILDKFNCPLSEEIHQTTLSLPISYGHTEEDVKKVIEVLNKF